MRKRTSSQHSSSNAQNANPRSTVTTNPSSQNYLHILKQSSTAYKASKLVGIKKPETLTPSLKSTNTRAPSSNKSESGTASGQKLNNFLTSFTPNVTSHKANNSSITIDLRPTYLRASQKAEAKTPATSRNNSESRIKANVAKSNEMKLQKQKFLSDSLPITEDLDHQAGKNELGISSIQPLRFPHRHNSMASIEFPGSVGMFGENNTCQDVNLLGSNNNNIEQKSSIQKQFNQPLQKRHSQASLRDFFSESFENCKDCKPASEDFDGKREDRCMNHPQKRAKYYTMSENDLLVQYKLCSKCAVALADKGAKVRELINTEEELRKSEIEGFVIKVAHSKRNSKGIFDALSLKKSDFVEFFSKQNEKVDAIAAVLQELINEEVTKTKNSFEVQKVQIIGAIESLEKKLRAEMDGIDEMQIDIERNLENILKHIGLKPFKKIISSYQLSLQDFDIYLEAIRAQKVEVCKLPSVKAKHIQELKPKIQAFFDLREYKTSILKRLDGEHEEKMSEDSSRQANRSSLYISFENNRAAFDSARGSILESQREGDRHSFACDQSAILKAVKQIERTKTVSSTGLDTETSSQTLKTTPQARRMSEEMSENKQLRRKSGFKNGEDGYQSVDRHQIERGELATVYSRRSSCPSNNEITITQVEDIDRDEAPSLLNKNAGTKSVGKLPSFPETRALDRNQIIKEYCSLPISEHRIAIRDSSDEIVRTSESMIREDQKEDQDIRKEEEDKNMNSLTTSERKKLQCNPFARRKQKTNDSNWQSKNHSNSGNFVEGEIFLNNALDQPLYAGPYRSPNFKESPEK